MIYLFKENFFIKSDQCRIVERINDKSIHITTDPPAVMFEENFDFACKKKSFAKTFHFLSLPERGYRLTSEKRLKVVKMNFIQLAVNRTFIAINLLKMYDKLKQIYNESKIMTTYPTNQRSSSQPN